MKFIFFPLGIRVNSLYLYNILLNFDRGSPFVQDPENDNLLGICIYTCNTSLPGYDRVLSGFDIIQILLFLIVHPFNVYLEFSGQFCSISSGVLFF